MSISCKVCFFFLFVLGPNLLLFGKSITAAESALELSSYFFNVKCPVNSTYNPISESCVSCMENASPGIDGTCHCNPGFARVHYVGWSDPVCVNCAAENKVVSPLPGFNGSFFCVSCESDPIDSERSAAYNPETQECVCANESSTVVTMVNSVPLTVQHCVPFADILSTCSDPYIPLVFSNGSTSDGKCTCMSGFTQMDDGSCVSSTIYQEMEGVAEGTSMNFAPPNLEGSSGILFPFPVTVTRMVQSATKCYEGNSTECEFLSNICVMMNYDTESTPCSLYLYLYKSLDAEVTRLPKLYYFESSADIFQSFSIHFSRESQLSFVVSIYDISGVWLGMKTLETELNLCDQSNLVMKLLLTPESRLEVSCNVNWNWIATQNGIIGEPSLLFSSIAGTSTHLYEIFLRNPLNQSGELIPVPVLLDFSDENFNPKTASDPFFFQPDVESVRSTSGPPQLRYFRRFYVYSTVESTNTASVTDANEPVTLVTSAARTVSLVFLSFTNGQIALPFYAVQYASHQETLFLITSQLDALLPLALSPSEDTLKSSVRTISLSNAVVLETIVIVLIVVVVALCVVTASLRLYGHMRRRQNMLLDFSALLVWCMFFLNHISNCFVISLAIVTWIVLVLYKFYGIMLFSIAESQDYIYAIFILVVIGKGVVVLYRLMEQCNAEYFIIDWERSKGQLLRENELVPVSMWRSNFVANQLNRFQTLRYFHVKLALILIMTTLLEFDLLRLTESIPTRSLLRSTEFALRDFTLCVGIGTFLWWAISLVVYLIEFQLYYRFIVVNPFQAFVDLCSVSNISVLILLEPMWGFYIHGRTIHAHADVSMDELQRNLALEAEGNLPVRGLGGQSKCQTFEVFISPYMREYLNLCKLEIEYLHRFKKTERYEPMRKTRTTYQISSSWHFLEFLKKRKRQVIHSKGGMIMKEQINQSLQQCVHRAEGSLFSKMILQRLFDFPPNIMYMNGAQRGDVGSKDLFFFDPEMSFRKCFLCGFDFDVCLFCSGFFALVMAYSNVYVAVIATFFIDFFIQAYREKEGRSNFSLTSFIPESFLR